MQGEINTESIQDKPVKKLDKLEITLSRAQHLMSFGSWEIDLGTMTRYWSDEVYNILEIDPDNRGGIVDPFRFFLADSANLIQTLMAKAIEDGHPGM